jgi:hypothetical protein
VNNSKNVLAIILFGFFVLCNTTKAMERNRIVLSPFLIDTGAELYELEQVEAIGMKHNNFKLESENVYACSSAGCRFFTKHKNRIKKHQEMHEAMPYAKIYRCNLCDYMIDSQRNMENHKNSHNSQKEWHCDVCNTGFKSDRSRKRHYNSQMHQHYASIQK